MATVFDELERAWEQTRETRTPVTRWAAVAVLAGQRPADLVRLANRGCDRDRSDRAMRALVEFAASGDDLATMTVVHMLLPAAKGLARRLRLDGDAEERALAVVEALWERVRTYPLRRQGTVSGNCMADVVGVLTRRRSPQAVITFDPTRADGGLFADDADATDRGSDSWHPEAAPARTPADELLLVLCDAVKCGHLRVDQAALISSVRIGGRVTERRRRNRAEARLIAALHAA